MKDKYLAYLRVSKITESEYILRPDEMSRQEFRNNFTSAGLKGQLDECERAVNNKGGEIVKVIQEIESGRKKRSELEKAVNLCEANGWSLVLADTDRICRDFIGTILITERIKSKGLKVLFADNPDMDEFIFVAHAYVASKQWESTSKKQKRAYQACVKRGKTSTGQWYGNPNWKKKEYKEILVKHAQKIAQEKRVKAYKHPDNTKAYAFIRECWDNGLQNFEEIAKKMADAGFVTTAGHPMHRKAVNRIFKRGLEFDKRY